MRTRFGACVARARLQARFGSPMPTKTVSPSHSSRAAVAAMSSAGRASVPIVHPGRDTVARAQPLHEPGAPLQVLRAVPYAVHVVIQVARERGPVARRRLP